MGAQRRYCADLDARIDDARLVADTWYVVSEAGAAALTSAASDRVKCDRVDTVWVCTVPAAHARWRVAAAFDRAPER